MNKVFILDEAPRTLQTKKGKTLYKQPCIIMGSQGGQETRIPSSWTIFDEPKLLPPGLYDVQFGLRDNRQFGGAEAYIAGLSPAAK